MVEEGRMGCEVEGISKVFGGGEEIGRGAD